MPQEQKTVGDKIGEGLEGMGKAMWSNAIALLLFFRLSDRKGSAIELFNKSYSVGKYLKIQDYVANAAFSLAVQFVIKFIYRTIVDGLNTPVGQNTAPAAPKLGAAPQQPGSFQTPLTTLAKPALAPLTRIG